MITNNSKIRENYFTESDIKQLIKAKLENQIKNLPYGFWRCKQGKEHSKIAIKYLIEEHLKIPIEQIPNQITAKTFHEVGLFRLLVEFFESSYFKALEYTYPGKFKPWDFPKGMTGIWDGKEGKKRAIEAIQNLLDGLSISESEIPSKLSYTTFKKHGLGGMLQILFNSSPFKAIDAVFPNKYQPWEFHVKNFWANESIESAKKATKWLVEVKLKKTKDELAQIRRKHFLQHSLGQMLKIFYQNSHLKALYDAYPNYFKQKYFFNDITKTYI